MSGLAYVFEDDCITSWNEPQPFGSSAGADTPGADWNVWTSEVSEPEVVSMAPQDPIETAIDRSRFILTLGDNWDDAGSAGYSASTWMRATSFLRIHSRLAERRFAITLPSPSISPADSSSIDLYWRMRDRSLLINVPEDVNEPATYFGKLAHGGTIAGEIATDSLRPELVAWLTVTA